MILRGDALAMPLRDNSVDAVVTDPPYLISFMSKEFDRQHNGLEGKNEGQQMQLWHTQWLTEAYRVLKPGGSMLVMGGTRTFHRLACAIEDSGFIIKDCLMYFYGSGFPKAQDLTNMLKKRGINTDEYSGMKVGGIKPAYEPIIWAVKPPEGSYVDNILKHGVGFVNVNECRVGIEANGGHWTHKRNGKITYSGKLGDGKDFGSTSSKGRFPANVILSHHSSCRQVGVKRSKSPKHRNPSDGDSKFCHSEIMPRTDRAIYDQSDKDGYEQVESWDCHTDCPIRLLDEQSGVLKSGELKSSRKKTSNTGWGSIQLGRPHPASSGGASRFFYCAKASRGERNAGLDGMEEKAKPIHIRQSSGRQKAGEMESLPTKNNHPTVKPIKLFEYLIKLVTREGQIILDPFIGSGTTAIAAHNVGRKCVGIEKEEEYLTIAKRRIDHWKNQPKQMEIGA